MKWGFTELVFILDRSGSMSGLEKDTIGGFNAMIEKQKKQEGTCSVTTVLFSNSSTLLHDRIPLEQIVPMTEQDYSVGGCTALLDALGSTIRHISDIHRYSRPEDVPEHTIFVITTDGMENASREYTSDAVKEMIREQKAAHGWEFLFLAANIDAVETAARYGIERDRAATYRSDGVGTGVLYDTVSEAICEMRASMPLSKGWSDKIKADLKSRENNQKQN